MVHYYYIDHSKQQSSGQSESSERSNNQQVSFSSSGEILNGKFFLFGQSVWIICQLLGKIIAFFNGPKNWFCTVDKILTTSELDPIRRYLAPVERPKPNSRYSSIQVDFLPFLPNNRLIQSGFNTVSIHCQHPKTNIKSLV